MKALRYVCIVAALTVLLAVAVQSVRVWAYYHIDPYLIDYDAPGVDITSEGP